MTQRSITYYFSLLSPWAYIGHADFVEIARKHEVVVEFRPVNLMEVFAETGGMPLPKRHPARQRYRIMELQRWRDRRGLGFNLHPRYWPFDVKRADRVIVAAVASGQDPIPYVRAAHAAIWERDENLADQRTIAGIAAEAFANADALLQEADTPTVAALYEKNTNAAIASDAFGSPVYVLDGEVFWGQDRLELLDDALASGRGPYLATA